MDLPLNQQFNHRLNHENAALIILAHQTTITRRLRGFVSAQSSKNLLTLSNIAKRLDVPAILTTSSAIKTDNSLVQEILPIYPHSKILSCSNLINAWQDRNFRASVEQTGRNQLILTGINSDVCLPFTAISAAKEGYQVHTIIDESETGNTTVKLTINQMTQVGCKMTNWLEVAAQLQEKLMLNSQLQQAS